MSKKVIHVLDLLGFLRQLRAPSRYSARQPQKRRRHGIRSGVPTVWSAELLEDRSLLSSTSLGTEAAWGISTQEVSSVEGGLEIMGPTLLKDINSQPVSSFPGVHDTDRGEDTFAVLNGIAYFFADDGVHGRELWRTDGTAAGTYYVADINPGAGSSSEFGDSLVATNDMLFLNAVDGVHGGELWTSDGTPQGTSLVKDLTSNQAYAGLQWLTNVDDHVYYIQNLGSAQGTELVLSYGTAATTYVIDIYPGSSSSIPWELTQVGDALFFQARDATHGWEPYSAVGLSTNRLGDLFPGIGSSSPREFADVNGQALFMAQDDTDMHLWLASTFGFPTKIDTPRPPPAPAENLNTTNVNGTYFFNASDAINGAELWKFDGDPTHMTLVKDINPGTAGSVPGDTNLPKPVNLNGMLYFVADDGTHGLELWKSDGSEGGTQLVKDLTTGSASSTIESLATLGTSVFFVYDDGVNGRELWKTDGTADGTLLVKDINPGTAGSGPVGLFNYNGMLLFSADDGIHGTELWRTDGTTAGTTLVLDINTNTLSSTATEYVDVNGVTYFVADDGVHGLELWKTDRTEGGTQLVKDIYVGVAGAVPHSLTNVNGTLYFVANDGTHGDELWSSDGTPAGTSMVKDIVVGTAGSAPESLTNLNGQLYFVADDGVTGQELWRSNGTELGTTLVQDVRPGSVGSAPSSLLVQEGILYFAANDGTTGEELWRTDGTTTALVKDIRPGGGSSYVSSLTSINGILYFGADDGTHGSELWSSNGTSAGTMLVKDIRLGAAGSAPSQITQVDNRLFFVADDGSTGAELWVSDGTPGGTYLVHDIITGTGSPGINSLTAVGDEIYFTADIGGSGRELWKSSGSPGGVTQIQINPGTAGSNPDQLTVINGELFFSADGGTHGRELWRINSTMTSAVLIDDLQVGPTGSSPAALAGMGKTLFFTADDSHVGSEPWTLRVNHQPTDLAVTSTNIDENLPAGAVVGTLTTTDADVGDMFTYSLVPGYGDNALFAISGGQLQSAAVFNYETKSSYDIQIRTTDEDGLSFDKVFVITVNDVNEAPGDIVLSDSSVPPNSPVGTVVGDLSATDPDPGDTPTFSLTDDAGGQFAIAGNQLVIANQAIPPLPATYSVTVQVTDPHGLSSTGTFTIHVTGDDPTLYFASAIRAGAEFTDLGTGVATDTMGNVYVTGIVEGDAIVAKYTSTGTPVWTRALVGWFGTQGTDITVDGAGNVYWTGSFRGTVDFDPGPGVFNLSSPTNYSAYVQKLNSSGNFVWAGRYGGTGDVNSTGIALDTLGNVYTTGDFSGTVDFNPGSTTNSLTSFGDRDVFVAKLDNGGNYAWRAQTGSAGNDTGHDIALDSSNNVYVTGSFVDGADFDPGPGNFIVNATGGDDAFLWKLSSAGSLVWAHAIGGMASDYGQGLAVDTANDVYLTGYFFADADFDPGPGVWQLFNGGGSDVFTVKFHGDGTFVWGDRMGGTSDDYGQRVAVDPSGSVFVLGRFQGTSDFNPGSGTVNLTSAGLNDVFIARVAGATGNYAWAGSLGGTSQDQAVGLALDGVGTLYAVGFFEGTSDFDPGPGIQNLTSVGETDLFVSQLTYAYSAPSVTINQSGDQSDPTNEAAIDFTVVFDEAVTGFATGDVTVTGTAPGTLVATVTPVGGDGTTYHVSVTGMTGSGTVIVAIGAGVAHDNDGHGNRASTSTDNSVLYDVLSPTATLADPTNGGSIPETVLNGRHYLDVSYSDPGGSGLNLATILDADPEFTINGLTIEGTPTLVSGTTYRYQFTGTLDIGPVTVDFLNSAILDNAGNASTAATQNFTVTTLPGLTINDVIITEGDAGSVNATFTVTLSAISDDTVTVQYATADGTATAGADYTSRSGTLTFAPGTTSATISVPILGERLIEGNETFSVMLSTATNAVIADDVGLGQITNNDFPPSISISDVTVNEKKNGSRKAKFTVSLSTTGNQPVTVAYATTDGTATAGLDYVAQNGVLTFPANKKKAQKIKVTVLGDQLNEPNETFQIILSNPTNAILGDGIGMGMIINADGS